MEPNQKKMGEGVGKARFESFICCQRFICKTTVFSTLGSSFFFTPEPLLICTASVNLKTRTSCSRNVHLFQISDELLSVVRGDWGLSLERWSEPPVSSESGSPGGGHSSRHPISGASHPRPRIWFSRAMLVVVS